MIKKLGAVVLATFLISQPASGMFSYFGFGNKEKKEKPPQKIISLLEDPDKLLASDKFKCFMKEVDAPLSYGFMCHLVRQRPDMMEKKFGCVIANIGGFGIGKVLSVAARSFGFNKLMVDGMLNEEKRVADIFGSVCGKKNEEKKPISIKEMLELELKKKSTNPKFLAGAVGRFAAGIALQCVVDNQEKIPAIIIKEMVVGEKKGPKKLDEEKRVQSEQSGDKSEEGNQNWALTRIVKFVFNKCVSDGPNWKTFFGKMAEKVYAKEKNNKLLQMTE